MIDQQRKQWDLHNIELLLGGRRKRVVGGGRRGLHTCSLVLAMLTTMTAMRMNKILYPTNRGLKTRVDWRKNRGLNASKKKNYFTRDREKWYLLLFFFFCQIRQWEKSMIFYHFIFRGQGNVNILYVMLGQKQLFPR